MCVLLDLIFKYGIVNIILLQDDVLVGVNNILILPWMEIYISVNDLFMLC